MQLRVSATTGTTPLRIGTIIIGSLFLLHGVQQQFGWPAVDIALGGIVLWLAI